jgi:hypothetical protein
VVFSMMFVILNDTPLVNKLCDLDFFWGATNANNYTNVLINSKFFLDMPVRTRRSCLMETTEGKKSLKRNEKQHVNPFPLEYCCFFASLLYLFFHINLPTCVVFLKVHRPRPNKNDLISSYVSRFCLIYGVSIYHYRKKFFTGKNANLKSVLWLQCAEVQGCRSSLH